MSQQTSVDWLAEKAKTQEWFTWERDKFIKQAKAMEKEQIEKAIDEALIAYGIIKK